MAITKAQITRIIAYFFYQMIISRNLVTALKYFSVRPLLKRQFHRCVPDEIAASSHLSLAHTIWSQIVKPGDAVCDATCGNGYDAVYLSKLALKEDQGTLHCVDIQQKAIIDTEKKLVEAYGAKFVHDRVKMYCCNHEIFPLEIQERSIAAIVYNLGYLPGTHLDGDNRVVTKLDSTSKSLQASLSLLKKGGVLSVTAYRGHPTGLEETRLCNEFFASLEPKRWRVFAHTPINTPNAPILFTAYKRSDQI